MLTAGLISSAAVAVRRQTDNDDNSICLRRLLRETRDYAHIVTRSHYLALSAPAGSQEFLTTLNNYTFDEWAGEGVDHPDPARVEADLQSLLNVSERIRHYVNKRVAHFDRNGVRPDMMPTFQDLDDASKVIESLTQKYHLIFTGVWIGQLRPTIIYPWTEVFSLPWIPAKSTEVH